ncbi:MAG: carbohydrate-binding family 9-like protein [Opitutaceae bacterium]
MLLPCLSRFVLRNYALRRLLAVIVTALIVASSLGAAEKSPDPKQLPPPQRAIVPKLQGTIVVDGDLVEPVWKKAAVLAPFQHNDGSGREREATTVRIWYDDTALYLAWTCRDSDVQATFTARDSRFWEEEVAEFFVTSKDLTRYFELQWNPLGGVFDAIITNELDEHGISKKFGGDWSYTAKQMKSAVQLKGTAANSSDIDESWQVEVVIPFSDLGQSAPKPGEVWRANFYRFNRGKNQTPEQLSWSPTRLRGFHQPGRFGFLEFGR